MGLTGFNLRRREAAAAAAQAAGKTTAPPKPLAKMDKAELQALATDLKLSAEGTVAELRERIAAAQAGQGGDA